MSGGLVYRSIGNAGDALVVLDAARRVYAAINRRHDGWHLIQPARADDRRVSAALVLEGDLVCTCESGTLRGSCYRTEEARQFERGAVTSQQLARAFA